MDFHLTCDNTEQLTDWFNIITESGHQLLGDSEEADFKLTHVQERIQLTQPRERLSFSLDFSQPRYTQAATSQQLRKAIGMLHRNVHVLDMTMGLAKDAFQLAMYGHHVTAIESNALWVALVNHELNRVSRINRGFKKAVERLTPLHANSLEWLQSREHHTLLLEMDAIYLDPMYESYESKAQVKKEAQFLRMLSAPIEPADNDALLQAALDSPIKRIVVKRHPDAPSLLKNKIDPSHQITGKLIRYDVYMK